LGIKRGENVVLVGGHQRIVGAAVYFAGDTFDEQPQSDEEAREFAVPAIFGLRDICGDDGGSGRNDDHVVKHARIGESFRERQFRKENCGDEAEP
jgi:hypothetical protein